MLADLLLQKTAWSFSEEGLYSFLTTMSERGIPQVVGETGSADYLSDLFKHRVLQLWTLLLDDAMGDIIA